MSGETTNGNGPVFEVEFLVRDSPYPFVQVTRDVGCTFELAAMLPRPDERYAEYFAVNGVDPDRIVEIGEDTDSLEVTELRTYDDDGGLFEFLVSEDCMALDLAELGALPRRISAANGAGHVVADVPPRYDTSAVIGGFLEQHRGARLVSKREKDGVTPPLTHTAFKETLHQRLTDRQREVLETAFAAGYYEWPRRATGEEVAAELGISSPTFSEHIHTAERKLLSAAFQGPTAFGGG